MKITVWGWLWGLSIRGDRARLLSIRADYIHVTGLTIQWAYMCGEIDNADFIILSELVCHDSWMGAFEIAGVSSDNTLRYLAKF